MSDEEIISLKSDITDRVKNITNDGRTFLWLRSVYFNDLKNDNIKIGGGNLLIAMGNFSVLEYLSKVFYCLSKPLSQLPHKNGHFDPNAVDCFYHLIKNAKYPIDLGVEDLKKDEVIKFWDDWRNKLAHFNVQRYNNSAVSFLSTDDTKDEGQYILLINGQKAQRPSFEKMTDGWRCYVDLLNRDNDKIAEYIADFVAESKDDNKKLLKKWLDSNLL
jgi:hypothetical protein